MRSGKRYTLDQVARILPSWGGLLARRFQSALGPLRGGATALRLLQAGLAESTAGTYSSHWAKFQRYCEDTDVQCLPASTATVLAYVGWLADEGQVKASSLQQYLSAINRVHRDFDEEAPALGHHIAVQRQGMGALQIDLDDAHDVRVYLPCEVADRIVCRGLAPATRAHEVRRCAAVAFAFITLQRVSTSAKVEERDIGGDATHLWFRVRFEKGRDRRTRDGTDSHMRIVRMPLSSPGIARVAALLALWRSVRGAVAPSAACFAFPGESRPTEASVGTWLSAQLLRQQESAPPGFTYSFHSLRKGGATGAHSIGAPLQSIAEHGGWTASGSAERYISTTCPPSRAAADFFGYLSPTLQVQGL